MGILIASKRDGFRRCGVEHSSIPSLYADDLFSEEELAILEAESMLIVQRVAADPEGIPEKPWDKMTVAELKVYAAQNNIDLGNAAKRDNILMAIAAADGDD